MRTSRKQEEAVYIRNDVYDDHNCNELRQSSIPESLVHHGLSATNVTEDFKSLRVVSKSQMFHERDREHTRSFPGELVQLLGSGKRRCIAHKAESGE